jgi:hypothetical protein
MKDQIAIFRGFLFSLRCRLMRRRISIGKGLRIYKKLEIKGAGYVTIGVGCHIGGMRGDDGQYVTLYTHSPDAVITIGDNALLFAIRISSKYSVTIGDDFFAEEAGIVDTDFHSLNRNRQAPLDEDKEKCAVLIGNRVSLAARSIITKGVRIEDDAMIAPGAIVNKSIPSGCLAIGNPVKVLQQNKR